MGLSERGDFRLWFRESYPPLRLWRACAEECQKLRIVWPPKMFAPTMKKVKKGDQKIVRSLGTVVGKLAQVDQKVNQVQNSRKSDDFILLGACTGLAWLIRPPREFVHSSGTMLCTRSTWPSLRKSSPIHTNLRRPTPDPSSPSVVHPEIGPGLPGSLVGVLGPKTNKIRRTISVAIRGRMNPF